MTSEYTEKFKSHVFRVQVVIVLNLIFALYYFYLFAGSFFAFDELPLLNTARNGFAFLGTASGSYFLLQGRRRGKILTQLVGILGLLYMIGYGFYGYTFIKKPGYSSMIVISYTINYVLNIFIGFIYPIIAGYLILGKRNNELNLE